MWSFALEQEGQYKEAERIAWEGFSFEKELGPDAWLDHSLAHSLYFQGKDRLEDAMSFMKERCATWAKEDLHPFLYTHCWWHLALLHLGEPQHSVDVLAVRTTSAKNLAEVKFLHIPLQALAAGIASTGTLQHCDLLLDILLIRGLCVTAAEDAKPLDEFLAAVKDHSKEMAAGPGGAGGRAEAYHSLACFVADIFRSDLPVSETAEKRTKARNGILELKQHWGCLGGSEEQRGILLEAVKGPVVCGNPQEENGRGGGCRLL
ncbi:Ttc38 [Symbiodinium natans]|uniref:Ttc38 protein n=1 Tax=Symbiodinium natans TaxID=878477 RepID=A0A812V7R9_9DINO|nr:Ttc38 [Symbiodinium natans]